MIKFICGVAVGFLFIYRKAIIFEVKAIYAQLGYRVKKLKGGL